jgi:hypothetical protein
LAQADFSDEVMAPMYDAIETEIDELFENMGPMSEG